MIGVKNYNTACRNRFFRGHPLGDVLIFRGNIAANSDIANDMEPGGWIVCADTHISTVIERHDVARCVVPKPIDTVSAIEHAIPRRHPIHRINSGIRTLGCNEPPCDNVAVDIQFLGWECCPDPHIPAVVIDIATAGSPLAVGYLSEGKDTECDEQKVFCRDYQSRRESSFHSDHGFLISRVAV